MTLAITYGPLSELVPYDKNARLHDTGQMKAPSDRWVAPAVCWPIASEASRDLAVLDRALAALSWAP
jgi:hypothetical protein